jgi:hypothetical protein
MTKHLSLKTLLADAVRMPEQQLALFALLNLGMLDSLTNGVVSATEALRIFFNAENCLFIHEHLRDRNADKIMSRGVQLSDLFDALPPEEAQRKFQRELTKLRALCLTLLEEKQLVA